MAYRQALINEAMPFDASLFRVPEDRASISENRFNQLMDTGLRQAKNNESIDLDDAFEKLKAEIKQLEY